MAAAPNVVAPHIWLDERGVAYIDGTTTKVVEVVMNKQASGDTPEELRENMPHLTIAQVYAALAYYHDHRAELETYIERRTRDAEMAISRQPFQLTRRELKTRRKRLATEHPSE